MRLGLVITDNTYATAARGLLDAAQLRNWECRCFLTDRGVLLLAEPEFMQSPGVLASIIAVCELSVERYENDGLQVKHIDTHVIVGGQYQDAELVKNTDRVIVI